MWSLCLFLKKRCKTCVRSIFLPLLFEVRSCNVSHRSSALREEVREMSCPGPWKLSYVLPPWESCWWRKQMGCAMESRRSNTQYFSRPGEVSQWFPISKSSLKDNSIKEKQKINKQTNKSKTSSCFETTLVDASGNWWGWRRMEVKAPLLDTKVVISPLFRENPILRQASVLYSVQPIPCSG